MLVIWSLFVPCILYLRLSKFQLSARPPATPDRTGKKLQSREPTTTIFRDKRRGTFRRFDVRRLLEVSDQDVCEQEDHRQETENRHESCWHELAGSPVADTEKDCQQQSDADGSVDAD